MHSEDSTKNDGAPSDGAPNDGAPNDGAPVSAMMLGGKPAQEEVHLKRQVLLARLFPQRVARPRLGRYDVLEFVGEGGMGTVFAAYDPRLDRRVAVKLLRQAPGGQTQGRARMLREAKALARLSDPNIVTIHEVWEEDDEIYLAMEYVQGETLAEWQRPTRAWREVLEVYRQAGQGLAVVHAAGMVYRDFKPHNAIRRDDGVVKLLDFGLARFDAEQAETGEGPPASAGDGDGDGDEAADESAEHLTRPGTIMGTPAYMAPEQRVGAVADARSDQFSFCVALWEALYGALPLARRIGPDGEEVETLVRTEVGRESGVPAWVRKVIEQGLAREPDARHASMHALLLELGRDPAVRRRRLQSVTAGIVLALGSGLVFAELRTEPSTSCVEASAWWSAELRDAAEAGVMGAGGTVAAQTWALLSPRLDRHAQELSTLREEACESHRRGLLPSAHYDLQVACLERRKAGFAELTERLTRGDESAVANANKAVAALLSPSSCTDTEALLAEHPPPADPVVAARVAELRQALARAQTEESVGQHEEAEARAVEVRDEARTLDHPPLLAEALLRWGSAGMQAGREDAGARLDEALWLALVTEQRQVAAEAAAKRIFAHVELEDRKADVSEAIALARSLVERAGAADWRTQWVLDNNVAIARERRGEASRALEAYEAALSHVPDAPGSFERAATLLNMAPMQVRLGQPQQAERSARTAVVELTALLGSEHPQLRIAEASLAHVLRTSGRYAEAAAMLAGVLERFTESEPAPLWMLLEGTRIALGRGDLEDARAWCRRVQPRLERTGGKPSLWEVSFAVMDARAAAAAGDPAASEALAGLVVEAGREYETALALGQAEVQLALGRAAEVEVLVRPIAEDPAAIEQDVVKASVLLGRGLVAQEQWQAAHERLTALLDEGGERARLEPLEQAQVLVALSKAEAGLGRLDRAVARSEQAVAILAGFDRESPVVREAAAVRADHVRRRRDSTSSPSPSPSSDPPPAGGSIEQPQPSPAP